MGRCNQKIYCGPGYKMPVVTIDERIYNQAITNGMPPVLATLIVAQARHETAGYTSNVFKSCNNAFGYKWVGQSTAVGPCVTSTEGDSYAKYANVEHSTTELTKWIRRRQQEGKFPSDLTQIQTADDYSYLLKRSGYYGDTQANYLSGLIYWLSQMGSLPGPVVGGSALLLLLLALGIVYRKKLFGK